MRKGKVKKGNLGVSSTDNRDSERVEKGELPQVTTQPGPLGWPGEAQLEKKQASRWELWEKGKEKTGKKKTRSGQSSFKGELRAVYWCTGKGVG